MLIVCSGPDTYRAREKARELVSAFRAKHDPNGLATDVLDGSEGLPALLSRLAGGSLFAKKKLIRADGCLEKMKIADVRTLAAKLEADHDMTIVLTVEEEAPNAKTLEALKIAPLFHYPFEAQTGVTFRQWVRAKAQEYAVDQATADRIAERVDGDSWFAIHELEKQSVHPHSIDVQSEQDPTVFAVADGILSESRGWRNTLSAFHDDSAQSVALGQSRSYLEVRDGHAQNVHPYVARKLGSLRLSAPEARAARLLRAVLSSRSGLASGAESETLL